MDIDQVRLNLNQASIEVLKIIIALIMYGIALELKLSDFSNLFKNPKGLFAGLLSHLVVFPALTLILINVADVRASIALGLLMLAACPGGNLGNLVSSLSKGNLALSIGLTSISTILALITTPFILIFLGHKIPGADLLLTEIHLEQGEILQGLFLIMGIPLFLGIMTSKFYPTLSLKFQKVMKKISIVFLLIFIIGALSANYHHFLDHFRLIVGIVFVHGLLAFGSGFLCAKIFKLNNPDTKSLTILNGLKNSGLGLALVFQFFDGLGGMAMIVAWSGISQLLLGILLIKVFKLTDKKEVRV